MKFRIRHLSGSKAGQEEVLEGTMFRVGRDPSCDLVFDATVDDRVSANHAQLLVLDNGQVQLTDLGSSNGTFIGEQQISAPVPIYTGALVTFGDGGPQVSILFEAPTAELPAVAPPPPPKKSKKPLIIGVVVGVVLLLGVVLAVGLSGSDEAGEATVEGSEDPVDDEEGLPGLDDEDSGGDDGESAVSEEPPEDEPEGEESTNPWASLGVGSSFEFKTKMDMMMAGKPFTTETTGKHVLTAKDETVATVRYETTVAGNTTGIEQKIPLHPKGTSEGQAPEVLEEKETKVTVPAGEFSCTYRKIKVVSGGKETITEMWIDPKLPAAYKTVTTSDTTTTTTEMTGMDTK